MTGWIYNSGQQIESPSDIVTSLVYVSTFCNVIQVQHCQTTHFLEHVPAIKQFMAVFLASRPVSLTHLGCPLL
jgi:hypothetical protein